MSFATQPNEMVDMILNQTGIPMAQRIRLRAVSHRFRDILEDGLQHESSLAIRVVGPSDLEELKSDNSIVQTNDLIISMSHFTKKKAIALIGRLFPRLTELAINSNSIIAWRKATQLFGHFTRTLTSLKVDGHLKNIPTRNSVFRSLCEAINSLLNLSSLYLDPGKESPFYFGPIYQLSFVPNLATTFSRLERFTFANPISQNQATLIAGSLSSRCTHLRLELDHSVATFPLDEATNLTDLHLDYHKDTVLQFIRQLPQLTTLTLCDKKWIYQPNLSTVLKKIRPLSQVTQVTFLNIAYNHPLERPTSEAFTFPTITRLTLQLSIGHNPFTAMAYLQTLAFWFPNLSSCALVCPRRYHQGILSNQQDLPYTVKLFESNIDYKEPNF